ncbi:hypothetical protein L1987_42461 [Smallanthus sonchifolius]|uniref:Uncharacterized protein n=1 Tax=Smallanthus sonchifolius TaxID=185202 RepID=A0ACB9GIU2_9ASTR|nr:hypothetical protein L1987_42461 [Smallanthus sonchifolius]
MAIHLNNLANFTSNLANTQTHTNPSSKSPPFSFLSFGSNFKNPMMHVSVSCNQDIQKRSRAVAASVATTEKPSTVLEEIVLEPIKEISGTVNLPGFKSLSMRYPEPLIYPSRAAPLLRMISLFQFDVVSPFM